MRLRTEAKREAILAIAAKTFTEMGYERASMAEIAARVGGSKATLYGYFESKEQLFVEVAKSFAEKHLQDAFAELEQTDVDVPTALQRFGEKMLGFICQPEAIATLHMVVAEAGHSDIGRRFYEIGPRRALEGLTSFLQAAMDKGLLRVADPRIAAQHLIGLFESENMPLRMFNVQANFSRTQIRKAIERALVVFLAAYGS